MIVGSLFSGIGGFDLGLERAGHRVVWQVEREPSCRTLLRHHWPDVGLHEDVRYAGRSNLAQVDLICGGFPCQDLSVAGRREGLDGDRSGLWWEFARVCSELLPRFILIENVPGLRSSAGGHDLAAITDTLAELGYMGAWRSLDSRYFGVAQRRERVFLLAVRDSGDGCPGEILAIPEGLSGHPAPGRQAGKGAAGGPEGGAGGAGGVWTEVAARDWRPSDGTWLAAHEAKEPHTIVVGVNSGRGYWKDGDAASPLGAGPRSAHEGTIIAHTLRAEGHDASEDGTAIVAFDTTQITSKGNYSRPRPGDPCHPLAAGAHPPSIAYAEWSAIPRRLTPRECERLQGFPDDWTRWGQAAPKQRLRRTRPLPGRTRIGMLVCRRCRSCREATDTTILECPTCCLDRTLWKRVELADTPRYRALGNAVTVPVAHWLGTRLPPE